MTWSRPPSFWGKMNITDARVRKLKVGYHRDSDTLFVRVIANKRGLAHYWIQRLAIDGVRRDLSLGRWPRVSIDEARFQAMKK